MSIIKLRQPIEHIPSFTEYLLDFNALYWKIAKAGIEVPLGMLDRYYYTTDLEGWGRVLYDMTFNSNLYKDDRFDCENFAFKAFNICAERYGLNTLAVVIGDTPMGRHGFNMVCTTNEFLLYEPNEAFPFSGSVFEIGEFGYKPEMVII